MASDQDHGTRERASEELVNAVRSGPIGIIGSGTAAQEVSVRIHDFGGGVSTVIRTQEFEPGGSPPAVAVIDGLRALDADAATQVIVLVGATPPPAIREDVRRAIAACGKPVVACFIGGLRNAVQVVSGAAKTTKEAALQAVVLSGIREEDLDLHPLNWPLIHEVRGKLTPEQQYVRGLFCAPELCAEAMYLAMENYQDVYGSLHPDPSHRLDVAAASIAHTYVVLGDGAARAARFDKEADDPEVGVIALDFVLGDTAGQDPVGEITLAIVAAKQRVAARGRHLEVLGYVLGTDSDTPSLGDQVARLESAEVTIASSSANTGLLSREFVAKNGSSGSASA